MTELSSYVYFEFLDRIEDRLSFGENHPERRAFLEVLRNAANEQRELKELQALVDFIEDSVNPKTECPDEQVKYLGLQDIEQNTGKARFKTMFGREILSTSKRMYEGNIVFSGLRPYLNKAHLVQVHEALGSAELFAIEPRSESVVSQFLLTYLLSDLTLTQTKWILTGSSYPRLSKEDFRRLLILLPKKPEQQSILSAIETMQDEASSIREEGESIERNMSNMIFKELGISLPNDYCGGYFFRTGKDERSPYFSIPFNDLADRLNYLFYDPRQSLLEQLSQQYSTTTLGQIVSVPIRRGTQPEYVDEGGVLVIKTVDLKTMYVQYDNCARASEECFEEHPDAHTFKGDILISSTGIISMGKVAVFERNEPAIVDGHISILRLKEEYDPYFVAYFLTSDLGKVQVEKWWSGSSGQIELQPTDLARFIVPDSSEKGISLDRQREIANKVSERLMPTIRLERRKDRLLAEMNRKFARLLGIHFHFEI